MAFIKNNDALENQKKVKQLFTLKLKTMDTNTKNLMKHFSTVLRNRALEKQTDNLMSQNLAFYFTRKELIEMIKKRFVGAIPKEHNLVELENKELLELVGDELYIISFVTEKWSKEIVKEAPKKELTQKRTPP